MSQYTDISQKLVLSSELELGMFVSKLDCPWEQTPFIFQGFLITNKDEIYQLQEHCQEVYIDIKKTKKINLDRPNNTPPNKKEAPPSEKVAHKPLKKSVTKEPKPSPPRYVDTHSFENELSSAVDVYQATQQKFKHALENLNQGKDLDSNVIRSVIQGCVKSILRNTNALTWLNQIRNKNDYTNEHALRVAVMSIAFGKELELDENELENLGICGLLHDIGKTKIPDEILNKEGRLNAEEFRLMRTHPAEGRALLQSKAGVFPNAMEVAYSHHERIDGKGYPQGITGEKIPYFSKIIAITDSFDAITSNRCYRKGISATEALRVIYDERGLHYDRELAERFVKFIGVYPPGHLAELNTGHIGIILANTHDNKLKPKLLLVRGSNKKASIEKILDLNKVKTLKNGIPLRIKQIHNDGAFGIKLQVYLDKALHAWKVPTEESISKIQSSL